MTMSWVIIGAVVGSWLGIAFDSPAHLVRTLRKRLRHSPRGWPVSAPRGPCFVLGEAWPSYIPALPSTHAEAERERMLRSVVNAQVEQRAAMLNRVVEQARSMRNDARGCVTSGASLFCVRHGRLLTECISGMRNRTNEHR